MALTLTSPAFAPDSPIPRAHTCDGENRSPALAWSGAPEGTRSLVLIVDDPDAPDPAAPRMTFVHWVVYNLPPETTGLAADVNPQELPPPARAGLNDWRRIGYGGPCPPIGRHRYFFKLYALDAQLPELDRATKTDIERAMRGHVLAEAQLMGTYQKQR